MNRIEE
jgi:hypothetical protein